MRDPKAPWWAFWKQEQRATCLICDKEGPVADMRPGRAEREMTRERFWGINAPLGRLAQNPFAGPALIAFLMPEPIGTRYTVSGHIHRTCQEEGE